MQASWVRTTAGLGFEDSKAIAIAPNGDFVMMGYAITELLPMAPYDMVFTRRSAATGDVVWQTTIPGTHTNIFGERVVVGPDEEITFCGIGSATKDLLVLQLDAMGQRALRRTIGIAAMQTDARCQPGLDGHIYLAGS